MKRFIPYAILVLGMPAINLILFYAVPDIPGSGSLVYIVPLVCLIGFAGALPLARYKKTGLHLLLGVAVALTMAILNILIFGWMALKRDGLAGTQ